MELLNTAMFPSGWWQRVIGGNHAGTLGGLQGVPGSTAGEEVQSRECQKWRKDLGSQRTLVNFRRKNSGVGNLLGFPREKGGVEGPELSALVHLFFWVRVV